jgi:hypothetical protein
VVLRAHSLLSSELPLNETETSSSRFGRGVRVKRPLGAWGECDTDSCVRSDQTPVSRRYLAGSKRWPTDCGLAAAPH